MLPTEHLSYLIILIRSDGSAALKMLPMQSDFYFPKMSLGGGLWDVDGEVMYPNCSALAEAWCVPEIVKWVRMVE